MAFIAAGLIALGAIALAVLGLMADAMSDAPGQTSGVAPLVVGGLLLAAVVASTHWLHISW